MTLLTHDEKKLWEHQIQGHLVTIATRMVWQKTIKDTKRLQFCWRAFLYVSDTRAKHENFPPVQISNLEYSDRELLYLLLKMISTIFSLVFPPHHSNVYLIINQI